MENILALDGVGCPDVLEMENSRWRVDDADKNSVMAIRMEAPHTIRKFNTDDILNGLKNGMYRKVEDVKRPPVSTALSEEDSLAMRARRDAIEWVLSEENPAWEKLTRAGVKNKKKKEAAEKLGITQKYFSRLMTRYLCSGRNQYSLIDNRKFNHTGTQSEIRESMGLKPIEEKEPATVEKTVNGFTEDEILQTGFKYFCDNPRIQDAYDRIMYEFYTEKTEENGRVKEMLMPKSERISYMKFYRYIKKRISGMKVSDFRKGPLNTRNNLRPITGNMQTGVATIGQRFQMDEFEAGIYLVDERTHQKVVGKPVVYTIVDTYSWMIVGCYIGFDNNSYAGFCNAIASMLEPHENQTSKYGVHCTAEEFPSMVLPKEICVDLGAEYRSKAVERVQDPLGITLTFTSPGCGSLKGAVECSQGRIQKMLENAANKCGQIQYEDPHCGDKAREQAVITISTFRAMVYKIIIELNKTRLPGYQPDEEMAEAGIDLKPCEIWKYETERCGNPVNISEDMRMPILFDLMQDDETFEIGRNGIKSARYNLFYRANGEWFDQMVRDGGKNTEVRYDPEHIETVYVRYKKEIHTVPFAPRHEELNSYRGFSWKDYRELMKGEDKEAKKAKEDEDYLRRIKLKQELREMVRNEKALKRDAKNETKNIKENRREERKADKKSRLDDKTRMENGDVYSEDSATGNDLEYADDLELEDESLEELTDTEETVTSFSDLAKHLYDN